MQQITLSHAASRYTTPFVSAAAAALDAQYRPAATAPGRPVPAANLLSIAMCFEASAKEVEIEPATLETEQLAAVARIAWAQYHEAGKLLARGVRVLRNRMSSSQYTQLLEALPGFML
jgi:hypothetical protein